MELQTVKTSELTGAALDWAVAKCEGWSLTWDENAEDFFLGLWAPLCFLKEYTPSTIWVQGGPIIERELLSPEPELDHNCKCFRWCCHNWTGDGGYLYGPTPLIAAMRCYVASKLGDCVDLPKELLVIT